MKLYYPSYYNEFHCIAGACPDSCCHEWTVQVDDDKAAWYRSLPGQLGDDLRQCMTEEEGCTVMINVESRCPMWREDGLCRIQAELGEGALCNVCRDFPRLRQDYGDFVELGLEMSCLEAARIMLTTGSWVLESQPLEMGDEPDYDPEIMDILQNSRDFALDLMTADRYSVPERLAILLLYGYHIQGQIDGAEPFPFDPDAALAEAKSFAGPGDFGAVVELLQDLEILTDRWKALLTNPPAAGNWDKMFCKLASYGIYRYWYQAVSDWDLAARVKLLLLHAITARNLGGGMEIIQLYSKEIENDADNLDSLLDAAYTTPALTDANLLGLLLGET